MKISEIINMLTTAMANEGDIDVGYYDEELEGYHSIENATVFAVMKVPDSLAEERSDVDLHETVVGLH